MNDRVSRRQVLRVGGLGALAAVSPRAWPQDPARSTPGAFADELTRTPRQTEGPFYPRDLPLDTDNDLLVVNDAITAAVGTVVHLSGRVLGPTGTPVRNAVVEIWQVDDTGAYLHPDSAGHDARDTNFQGFGRFLTGSTGEYYFRTIQPVAYPGRTPHIHVKVKHANREVLTTQCYIKGHPGNEKDTVLRGIRDEKQRANVLLDYVPIPESKIGELGARFEIVLGKTPGDGDER